MTVSELISVFQDRNEIHILNMFPYCHCLYLGTKANLKGEVLDKLKDSKVIEAYTISMEPMESRLTILIKDNIR